MNKELELWQFIADRLTRNESVMLLVVVESSGSSPGRQGYKMAVGSEGELCGSIGGGVMEVSLVEQARSKRESKIVDQVHRKDVPDSSGMICSGKQTVIFRILSPQNIGTVEEIIETIRLQRHAILTITPTVFSVEKREKAADFEFEKQNETEFRYSERLGYKNTLNIIGGGHCALALSELMAKMDFYIRIFDDRPELNTIEKNRFADAIEFIDSYENIAEHIKSGRNEYVVVMTLGYAFDKIVIQRLLEKEFKYFGVLGSKAKMATLMKELKAEAYDEERLGRIHTPIGIQINSHTPEEIAVSIAAEIISVKNSLT